jgi:hypothetical protein
MTPLKAYVLGFAWADGAINSSLNYLAFVSRDDLTALRDVFYGPDRPVYRRKSGTYQLNVTSSRIVQELVELGFTPQKSKQGHPHIPLGLEQYFLLGLLDGDGCIYSTSKVLRVWYCGNAETMCLVRDVAQNLTGVCFTMRASSTASPHIQGRVLKNNHVCQTLDLRSSQQSQTFLSWLYTAVEGIPFFQRKYQKFLDFQRLYQTEINCFLCAVPVSRNGTTVRYCPECRLLLRRLSNRRSDHEKRNSYRSPFVDLLTAEEKERIDLNALASLG